MIAEEEEPPIPKPNVTLEQGITINEILHSIKQTLPPFLEYLQGVNRNLNENELTQELVARLGRRINALGYPFLAQQQYQDIENGSPGFSDFYFYPLEEGASTTSFFSVEAKRLPAPANNREREYVRDERIRNNERLQGGGIERYKIGTHGRQLTTCGMIAYVEREEFPDWLERINIWIERLTIEDPQNWQEREALENLIEEEETYAYTKSIAIRALEDSILLHHLWIKLPIR